MKFLIAAVYGVGVAFVMILSACVIVRADFVPFPNAMLPLKLYELAEIWLAIGFLPMFAATILFGRSRENFSRVIYLPAIICAGFVIRLACEVLTAWR